MTDSFDDSPEGNLSKHVRAAISEFERGLITRRTMRGRKASLSNGGYSGGSFPYGYIWSKQSGWVVVPEHSKVVEQIFGWYVHEGFSFREIAKKINELSLPLPRGETDSFWTNSQVSVIISQPAYIGQYYGLRGKVRKKFKSVQELHDFANQEGWTRVGKFPAILQDNSGNPNFELLNYGSKPKGREV